MPIFPKSTKPYNSIQQNSKQNNCYQLNTKKNERTKKGFIQLNESIEPKTCGGK